MAVLLVFASALLVALGLVEHHVLLDRPAEERQVRIVNRFGRARPSVPHFARAEGLSPNVETALRVRDGFTVLTETIQISSSIRTRPGSQCVLPDGTC